MNSINDTTTPLMELTTVIPEIVKRVTFSWYDYSFFTLMLLASVIIGIYFGCFGSKQSTASEYLLGGKQMKVIPIAISLVASHISGITLLAVPADVYKYGAAYQIGTISVVIVSVVTIYIFLPIFYKLRITSTYEYLELRFDGRTREFASFLFALSIFLYLPIVIYIPALAFSAATGLNIHLITPVVCGICIFYTTIGGLKAVVWTDTLQFTVTVGALITVFVLGIISAGGIGAIWNKSLEGQRLDIFDFDLDPTKRDSFWIISIGLTVHWISHTAVNQSCVQKFLAVPDLRSAKLAVIYYAVGLCVIKTFCVITGLIMYTKYADCDPFTTNTIKRNDQLLPYYVMDVAGAIPGLPGLFIAGVFSSALSTLSANLNCLAGTIYEDFVVKFMRKPHSSNSSTILKMIVVITGIISTALVLVFERLGGILPLTISIGGIVHGPLLGLFVLGALIPPANSRGAIMGGISGMFFVGIIWVMAKYYEKQGLGYVARPISVDGCLYPLNETLFNITSTFNSTMEEPEGQQFFLFRVSYYYYTLIGATITAGVGTLLSYVFRGKDDARPVDRDLLSPVIYRLLPDETTNDQLKYLDLTKAIHVVHKNTCIEEDQEEDMKK